MSYLGQHYFKQHSFTVSIRLANIQIQREPIIVQQTAGNQISDIITHSWLYSTDVILNKLIPQTLSYPKGKQIPSKNSRRLFVLLFFFNFTEYILVLKIFQQEYIN